MNDPTLPLPSLSPVSGKTVATKFDGGLLSSNGGVLLLREIEQRLRVAKRVARCSSDPICAEQSAGNEDYPLQGAACHACLLVPETSCEARNTRLDRGLLVETVLGRRSPLLCLEVKKN